MNNKIILCTGGARSGKSEFAEKLALSKPGRKGYIATGQAFDDEMKDRILKHQARRGALWKTYEIPIEIGKEWPKISNDCDVILLDCLTMFTTNCLLSFGDIKNQKDSNAVEEMALEKIRTLLDLIRAGEDKTVIFVTNELGLGIVPENPLARHFRDIAGRVNRVVAEAADEMYLTLSGITIEIKSKEVNING